MIENRIIIRAISKETNITNPNKIININNTKLILIIKTSKIAINNNKPISTIFKVIIKKKKLF